MIAPVCNRCGAELTEPGALAFGPPDTVGQVFKYHICRDCWPLVHGMITGVDR